MTTLFFDTETTGLKEDSLPPTHASQPMPVQLGMKLDADNLREVGALNIMIQAEDWIIAPGASSIHGIDKDTSLKYGTHLITAVELFLDYMRAADMVVAHNINFDKVVMQRATFVYHQMMGTNYVDPFEGKETFCTMLTNTDIVKAKPKRFGQWKWPRLEECIKFYFNETLDGAHDALVDVRGCARVYYQMAIEGYR